MSADKRFTAIQFRRGTAAQWSDADPVILASGEPGFIADTNTLKIGDGSTAFASLSAVAGGGGGGGSEVNDLSSVVTWANVPDANITESSVVQHSGALRITESQITDLQSYLTAVSDDTAPSLGGELNLNNNNITGTGNVNITGTVTATDFSGPLNGAVQFECKMIGADGKKGQVVYISGLSGNTSEVSLARSNSASTMPVFGILASDISQNSSGEVVTFGNLRNLDADDFVETGITLLQNDVLYVSSSEAGKITNVKPSGQSNLIQNIGKCIRHTPTTNMTFKVGGAGRTNDVPNLNEDQFFLGNASNQAVITDFSDAVGALTSDFVSSDVSGIPGASGVNNIVIISQEDFDGLSSVDSNTIYFIS